MTPLAWIAGAVMPLADARIALDDPGFLLGDGVFETLRARKGKPFRWDLHAERLAAGLAVVGIAADALAVAEAAAHELATRAAEHCEQDVYLRIQVSRLAAGRAEVTALVRPLPEFPARLYRKGARLAIAGGRHDPADPLAGAKSLSYLPQVWARRAGQARGFDDALIWNTFGRVCEAAHANVIARRGRVLYAPGAEEGALDGVTRRVLLATLPEDDYAVETRLDRDALAEAEEVLLTSTLAGVVPVSAIEELGGHYAGPAGVLATRLARAYEALLESASNGERPHGLPVR